MNVNPAPAAPASLRERLSAPRTYAAVSAYVATLVPEDRVGDVVHATYVTALEKDPADVPVEDAKVPAWLKGIARNIAPRFMKKQRREKVWSNEKCDTRAAPEDERVAMVQRLRALEPATPAEKQALECIEQVIAGESLAKAAASKGLDPKWVSKAAWRLVPKIAKVVAGALGIVFVLWIASLMRGSRHEEIAPLPPEPSFRAPSPMRPAPPQPAPLRPAGEIRDDALRACAEKRWRDCSDGLRDATNLDPQLVREDPRIMKAWREADEQIWLELRHAEDKPVLHAKPPLK